MPGFLARAAAITLVWKTLMAVSFLSLSCGEELTVGLPFGDVNVVAVTDVHSWVAGHGRHPEEHLDADYGDVLSFYERLQKDCQENGRDLWFVMNGDFIDGTGLSKRPPKSLVPLLEKMPWDVVNIGNHELYDSKTIEFITQPGGFAPWLGERYMSSNVVHASTGKPLGHRYHVLKGRHSSILTFGFLFNMENASPIVHVEKVEKVVKTDWFVNALSNETFDAIMVLAHMDVRHELVDVILASIRAKCGQEMPVQFITGHSHYRGYNRLDNYSTSFEAGRYLDTVGFVSFPTKNSATNVDEDGVHENNEEAKNTGNFGHRFLDANVNTLQETLGISNLETDSGRALSTFIHATQKSMGLSKLVGCAPITFNKYHPVYEPDSLWGLYAKMVVPTQFMRDQSPRVLFQSKGTIRYNLIEGQVDVDDLVAVDPFNDTIFLIAKDVPGKIVLKLNSTLNPPNQPYMYGGKMFDSSPLPKYIISGEVIWDRTYDIYVQEYDTKPIQKVLANMFNGNLVLKPTNVSVGMLWLSFVEQFWSCKQQQQVSNVLRKITTQTYRADESYSVGVLGAFVAMCIFSIAMIVFHTQSKRHDYYRIN